MNTICNDKGEAGTLWKELADCIAWQRANADVLPDIHWVGGNPWNGVKSQIYGWASWNGKKATLALRNGANKEQTYRATLRQMLEIPAYINTAISLEDAFEQAGIQGIPTRQPVDIDQELTIVLPASSVYIYNGTDGSAKK